MMDLFLDLQAVATYIRRQDEVLAKLQIKYQDYQHRKQITVQSELKLLDMMLSKILIHHIIFSFAYFSSRVFLPES